MRKKLLLMLPAQWMVIMATLLMPCLLTLANNGKQRPHSYSLITGQVGHKPLPSPPPPPPANHHLSRVLVKRSQSDQTSGQSKEQNYSSNSLVDNSDLLGTGQLYPNYFLPPYFGLDSASYPIFPQPVLDQFAPYISLNQTGKFKGNKNGLGKRIGELMSTSAEKATKAFKSFSQFKLFNDIKPSRLLGLSNSQSGEQSGVPKLNMTLPLNQPASSWYFPTSPMSTWSSFAPPPASSSIFYQQPVYMRTQDNSNPLPLNANPNSLGSLSPPKNDFLPSLGDFYSPKLTIDGNGNFQAMNSNPAAATASTAVPSIPSSTTVYHHFNGGNSGQPDLFASPQTQYGFRVKPPKEYADFDSSNEEDISGEQDEASKMANDGQVNHNDDGRLNSNNNDNGQSNDNGNPHNWQSSYEDYQDPTNEINAEMFNQAYRQANRPYQYQGRRPHRPLRTFPRRPMFADDDTENWYNTFFGSNVKPLKSIRAFSFNGPSINFPPPPAASNNANPLNLPQASTPTPSTLTASEILSSFHNSPLSVSQNYVPIPMTSRPAWAFNMFGHPTATGAYYNFRPSPMMAATAASTMRPMTFAYPQANYFMPRYRTPVMTPYNFQATPTGPTPAATMQTPIILPAPFRYPYANPYPTMMQAAASTMYPVRIPYMPMQTIPFGLTTPMFPAPLRTAPMMRFRYGPEMPPVARRSINITKRAEIIPETKETDDKTKQQVKNSSILDIDNLATVYNAYQVLQKRMENKDSVDDHHPYYYYIGRDNRTESGVVTSTARVENDLLDSVSSRNSTLLRSLKTRHIDKRDHLEAASTLAPITTTTTKAPDSGIEKRQGKHLNTRLAFSARNGWKPVVMVKRAN